MFGSDLGSTTAGGPDEPSWTSVTSTRGVSDEGSTTEIAAIGIVFVPSYAGAATSGAVPAAGLPCDGSSTTGITCVSLTAAGSVSGTTDGASDDSGAMAGRRSGRSSPVGPRIAAGVYGFVLTRPEEAGRGGGGVETLVRPPGGAGSGRVLIRACGGSAVIGVGSSVGGGVAVGSTTTPGWAVGTTASRWAALRARTGGGLALARMPTAGAAATSAGATGTSSPSK